MRNGLLGALFLLAVVRLALVDWGAVLVSSVAEFLPKGEAATERASEAMRDAQARLVFFGGRDAPLRPAQAASLARALAEIPGVGEAGVGLGPSSPDALNRALFDQRIALLFPAWLADARVRYAAAAREEDFSTWLADDAVARLNAFLDSPGSLGFEELLESDPLGLLPSALASLAGGGPGGGREGGHVVWTRLDADPLAGEVQGRVLPEIERVVAETSLAGGAPVVWFGAIRFAAESRTEMQGEVAKLNLLSLLLVGAVAVTVLQRPWYLIHLLVPVVCGLVGGLAALTLFFAHIHMLSLVMGSILAGVAIDYGVHLFFHRGEGGSDGPVVKALLVSGLSTIAGFLAWSGSSLLLSRQTGVFVAAGLASALLAVLLYTPLRQPATPRYEALLERPLLPLSRAWRLVLGLGVVGVAIFALARVHWNDSLEMLDIPHPELAAAVAAVSAQGGAGMQGRLVFAAGHDFAEVAEPLKALGGATFGLAPLFPDVAAMAAANDFGDNWPRFLSEWHRALEAEGFAVDAFAPFEAAMASAWDRPWRASVNAAGRALSEVFRGPSSVLVGMDGDLCWLGAWTPAAAGDAELPAGVARLAVREALEAMIGDWRREQVRLSLIGIAVIALIVLSLFPARAWPVVVLLPIGAVGCALAVLGWGMHGLNLFHLAGGLLGFCVTLDYVVFFENCRRGGHPFPASIRFSAITTAGAFGLLLLSRVEGVQSLGATVALSVGLAIFGLELVRPRNSTIGHD